MSYSTQNNTIHADDVAIFLTVKGQRDDEFLFQNFPIGFADKLSWRYVWNTRTYRAIGDDNPLGSDIFRNNLSAEGQLSSVVIKHSSANFDYIDIGTKLLLGTYDLKHQVGSGFDNVGELLIPFSDVRLRFYAQGVGKGYVFSRITPTSVEGGINQGQFMAETLSFTALDVKEYTERSFPNASNLPLIDSSLRHL